MSRIGKNPIAIPAGVTVEVKEAVVTVKGKLGELTQEFSDVTVKIEDNQVIVERSSDHKDERAKHGLYRSLINNMIVGVSEGFTKQLELVGVGYRASNQGQKLDLALGFSHNIVLDVVSEVTVETVSEKGKNPIIPKHYFPNDDPTKKPIVRWRSHANLLFSNWLNYFVYQITPYDIDSIN